MAQIGVAAEVRLEIRGAIDVERARRAARALADSLGFGDVDQEMVVLSVSELATNLARYAVDGCLFLRAVANSSGIAGVEVESRDGGPGIADPLAATHGGESSSHSLGEGLASVRRLMDLFELHTSPEGTTVVCRKWRTTP